MLPAGPSWGMRRAGLALAIGSTLGLACGIGTPDPGVGTIKGNVYRNEFFKLSVPIPDGWEIDKPPVEADRFMDYYTRALTVKSKQDPPLRVHNLLRIKSAPTSAWRSRDVAVTLCSAYVKDKPDEDRRHMRFVAREFAKKGPIPTKILREEQHLAIGGADFDGLTFSGELSDGTFYESEYTGVRDGYALVFGLAGKSEESLKRGRQVLGRVRFDGPIDP